MGKPVDYPKAKQILEEEFTNSENDFLTGKPLSVPESIVETSKKLFSSATQAFRESLAGCLLARILDPEINIRLPYMNQGDDAFNGRTLGEKVVNPFLRAKAVPCSKGPYLSVFRRNVGFVPETASGLRDKRAFEAMLDFIGIAENSAGDSVRTYLRYLLYCFIAHRESSSIPLANIQRLSLEQIEELVGGLLQERSGGLLPLLMAVAVFNVLVDYFSLDWTVDWQEINVADSASRSGGDITIKRSGEIILAVEVTERPVEGSRVVSTFDTKISPFGIQDYLFLLSSIPHDDARSAARKYFAQGHDISFLPIKDWLVHVLGAVGGKGRKLFINHFRELLNRPNVPAALRVAWNDRIKSLF